MSDLPKDYRAQLAEDISQTLESGVGGSVWLCAEDWQVVLATLRSCRSPVACAGFGYCRERNQPQTEDGISWLRYARHESVPELEAKGWVAVADLGLPHSHHAILMQYAREGEPV